MKSQQHDSTYQTACKNCVFAVYDGDTQVDCSMGRISKYQDLGMVIDAYDEEKEFYVINGICNVVRQSNWNHGVVDATKARQEVRPKFKVFVNASHMTESHVADVVKMHHDTNFECEWSVLVPFDLPHNKKTSVVHTLLSKLTNATVTECADIPFTLGKLSLETKKSFVVVLDHISLAEAKLFTRVDELLNDDLQKFIIYTLNGTSAISSLALHMMHRNLDTMNFDSLTDATFDNAIETDLIITEVDE